MQPRQIWHVLRILSLLLVLTLPFLLPLLTGDNGGDTEPDDLQWDFRFDQGGWRVGQHLETITVENGGQVYLVQADDPYLNSPPLNGFRAEEHPYLLLELASGADANGQIYFRRADEDFAEERRLNFRIVPDNSRRRYVLNMASLPTWQGEIVQLRLDPAGRAVGNGLVRIYQVEVMKRLPVDAAPPVRGG
jgi:hypothetical protein